MERDKSLTDKTIKFSKKIGMDILGFADPKYFTRFPLRNRPEAYLKNAKTVIILGVYLYDIILDTWSQDQINGKSFHYLDSILENGCYKIKSFLQEFNYESVIVPYNPGLYLKDSAVLAGMGTIGKNNLLLTEAHGSQVRLRCLITEAPLITGQPIFENKLCKDCNKCIEACPAGALKGGYNKDACLSYNLANLRKLSRFSSIWCNICIETCPFVKEVNKSNFEGYFQDS